MAPESKISPGVEAVSSEFGSIMERKQPRFLEAITEMCDLKKELEDTYGWVIQHTVPENFPRNKDEIRPFINVFNTGEDGQPRSEDSKNEMLDCFERMRKVFQRILDMSKIYSGILRSQRTGRCFLESLKEILIGENELEIYFSDEKVGTYPLEAFAESNETAFDDLAQAVTARKHEFGVDDENKEDAPCLEDSQDGVSTEIAELYAKIQTIRTEINGAHAALQELRWTVKNSVDTHEVILADSRTSKEKTRNQLIEIVENIESCLEMSATVLSAAEQYESCTAVYSCEIALSCNADNNVNALVSCTRDGRDTDGNYMIFTKDNCTYEEVSNFLNKSFGLSQNTEEKSINARKLHEPHVRVNLNYCSQAIHELTERGWECGFWGIGRKMGDNTGRLSIEDLDNIGEVDTLSEAAKWQEYNSLAGKLAIIAELVRNLAITIEKKIGKKRLRKIEPRSIKVDVVNKNISITVGEIEYVCPVESFSIEEAVEYVQDQDCAKSFFTKLSEQLSPRKRLTKALETEHARFLREKERLEAQQVSVESINGISIPSIHEIPKGTEKQTLTQYKQLTHAMSALHSCVQACSQPIQAVEKRFLYRINGNSNVLHDIRIQIPTNAEIARDIGIPENEIETYLEQNIGLDQIYVPNEISAEKILIDLNTAIYGETEWDTLNDPEPSVTEEVTADPSSETTDKKEEVVVESGSKPGYFDKQRNVIDDAQKAREVFTGIDNLRYSEVIEELGEHINEARSRIFHKLDTSIARRLKSVAESLNDEAIVDAANKFEAFKKKHSKKSLAIMLALGVASGITTAAAAPAVIVAGTALKLGLVGSVLGPNVVRYLHKRKDLQADGFTRDSYILREASGNPRTPDPILYPQTVNHSREDYENIDAYDAIISGRNTRRYLHEKSETGNWLTRKGSRALLNLRWGWSSITPEMKQEVKSMGLKIGSYGAGFGLGLDLDKRFNLPSVEEWTERAYERLFSESTRETITGVRESISNVFSDQSVAPEVSSIDTSDAPDLDTPMGDNVEISLMDTHTATDATGDMPMIHTHDSVDIVTDGSSEQSIDTMFESQEVSTDATPEASTLSDETVSSTDVAEAESTHTGFDTLQILHESGLQTAPVEIQEIIREFSAEQHVQLADNLKEGKNLMDALSTAKVENAVHVKNELLRALPFDQLETVASTLNPNDVAREVDLLTHFGGFDILEGVKSFEDIDNLDTTDTIKNMLKNEIAFFHIPKNAGSQLAELFTGLKNAT